MRNLLSGKGLARDPRKIRISGRDRILFAKRLSSYLRVGIPILDAIDLIRAMPGSNNHARLVRILSSDLEEGITLSRSLARFPRSYSPAHMQLISVGEKSGSLSASLSQLAQALEERASRIRSILSVLAYPLLLLIGSVIVSVFLIAYAFPKIVPLFRGLHATLPLSTRILISLSSFLQAHWMACLSVMFVTIACASFALRMPRILHRVHVLLLKLPGIGPILKAVVLISLFQTVGTLLSSGIRLDEAIRMAHDGIGNSAYRSSLERVRRAVLTGSKWSSALTHEPTLYPAVALQLVSLGEMTGTLAESSLSAAAIFKEDLSNKLQLLSTLLEPTIMVGMGFVIGFIALAIISPMYGITQNLSV